MLLWKTCLIHNIVNIYICLSKFIINIWSSVLSRKCSCVYVPSTYMVACGKSYNVNLYKRIIATLIIKDSKNSLEVKTMGVETQVEGSLLLALLLTSQLGNFFYFLNQSNGRNYGYFYLFIYLFICLSMYLFIYSQSNWKTFSGTVYFQQIS